jgi:hypothetical protein
MFPACVPPVETEYFPVRKVGNTSCLVIQEYIQHTQTIHLHIMCSELLVTCELVYRSS